ncbi:DEAD/DEAH box helicase [Xanthocytophaga agilis]|nr:DEAD/DEAH box helicase family protein [Xanthocytophaga agilis]
MFLHHASSVSGGALPLPNENVAPVSSASVSSAPVQAGKNKLALRDYQHECIQTLADKQHGGTKRVILCLPTGAGKTVTFSEITRRTLKTVAKGRVLILVDRIELLAQAAATLKKAGLQVGILSAGAKAMPRQRVVVAMVETYYRRAKKGWTMPNLHLMIIDEAHKGSFRKVIGLHPELSIIGATATPVAASKQQPLKDYFEDIVVGTEIHLLIESGYLAKPRYFAVPMEITASKGYDGDYKSSELYNDFNKSILYQGCVANQQKHAAGKKTLIFCVNIAHTFHTAQAFAQVHEQVRTLTSDTPEPERQAILHWFANTPEAILVNCGILTTGFDEPTVECIILNRATQSLPLYLQMCGRGSRTTAQKKEFILIDMGNNFSEHGLWHDVRDWSGLFWNGKSQKALDIAPTRQCPACDSIIALSSVSCPHCKYVFERTTQDQQDKVEVHTQEVDVNWPSLKQKSWSQMSVKELMLRAQLGNPRTGRPYKQQWILYCIMERENPRPLLEEFARIKGYRPGWVDKFMQENAYRRYL